MRLPLAIKYALEYIKHNRPLFIATSIVIGLTVIVLNLFALISFLTYRLSLQIQKQQKASVLFEPLTPKEEIQALVDELKNLPEIKTIEVTDSEALKSESLESIGINKDEFDTNTEVEEKNLLPILRIEFKPNIDHTRVVKLLQNEQKANPKIIRVIYFESVARRINIISRVLKYSGLSVIFILALVSAYLIHLTMNFSAHLLNEEIKTMKLIGASKHQVTVPFAIQGALIGIIGALIGNILTGIVVIPFLSAEALRPFTRIAMSILSHLDATFIIKPAFLIRFILLQTLGVALITFIIAYGITSKIFKKLL